MTTPPNLRLTSSPRCQLSGNYAADGWKNRRGWRCTNVAAWRSSGGTLFCDACRKHGFRLAKAEIAVATNRLTALRTARRVGKGTTNPRK